MTLSISISPKAEAKLRERAAAQGKDPKAYAFEILEELVCKPSLDEILAPFRAQVASSVLDDKQLDQLYEDLREEVWRASAIPIWIGLCRRENDRGSFHA